MRALLLAGVATLGWGATANATVYVLDQQVAYQQLNYQTTPDATPGYFDADTTIAVTNDSSSAVDLYYVAAGLRLNNINAPWSTSLGLFTTGSYTAQPISTIVLAAYEDVFIPEPTAAGYVSGGTIPLYVIGSLDAGQTAIFDVVRRTNTATVNTNVEFVAAVPEPASLALLGLGVAGIAVARRRRAA